MPVAQPQAGTTWNEAADVRNRFPELTTAFLADTTLALIVQDAQDLMKMKLRPHWDVDADEWSTANIETNAPSVKRIHLIYSGGLAFLAGIGKNTQGTEAVADYGAQLVEQADILLKDLIADGSLPVARRTSDADGVAGSSTSATLSDPVFTYEDETNWPYSPSSGTRDDDPWP